MVGFLLGLPMALPLAFLIISLLGGIVGIWWVKDLLTLSPEAKWIIAYPTTDAQGNEQWVSLVLSGDGELKPPPQELAQMMERGEVRANIALYLGPEDFKVFEAHLDLHLPLQELLQEARGEGPPP